MEALIGAIYKSLRENYDDVHEQVFNKYYTTEYRQEYVIIVKKLMKEFKLYKAIKRDGSTIEVQSMSIDNAMVKSMISNI